MSLSNEALDGPHPSVAEVLGPFRDRIPLNYAATATSILRAHSLMVLTIEATLADLDLTMPQYGVLATLASHPDGLPLTKISRLTFIHPASLTYTADKLEARKLLRRKPHPNDRRSVLAFITASGNKLITKAQGRLHALDWGLSGLTPEEADRATELLTHLRSSD